MRRLFLLFLLAIPAAVQAVPPVGRFKDAECVACHGPDSPEVQGWRLSKHGVLARISPPGRAPGCVDCHGADAHRRADPEAMRQTCGRCHSPRYIETLAANGQRMLAVG